MTTGNSGFIESEPRTEGETMPPNFHTISFSDGVNLNASTRCATAMPVGQWET